MKHRIFSHSRIVNIWKRLSEIDIKETRFRHDNDTRKYILEQRQEKINRLFSVQFDKYVEVFEFPTNKIPKDARISELSLIAFNLEKE